MIRLVVPFEPVAKGRPRFVKATGHAYTPPKTAIGEWQIRQTFLDQLVTPDPLSGPLRLTLTAYVTMPQSMPKRDRGVARPTKRPDLDQYIKTALDALNQQAYFDDSQVVEIVAAKCYCSNGTAPHWDICIDEVLG